MNCDRCEHSGLCLYEAGAREFEKSLGDLKDKPALISINLTCEKFKFKFVKTNIKDARVNKKVVLKKAKPANPDDKIKSIEAAQAEYAKVAEQ